MGRSRGFGSNPCYYKRPIQTRFRWASVTESLKQQHRLTRRLILQKARRHPGVNSIGLRLIVGDAVSGTLSLPSRGAFHLSLTVLCAIGGTVYLALGDGPPRFPQGSSCPVVLGYQTGRCCFTYRTLTLYGQPSQAVLFTTLTVILTPQPQPVNRLV
jgi:hypothetical protein